MSILSFCNSIKKNDSNLLCRQVITTGISKKVVGIK